MTIREMRDTLGDTQREFAARYNIPFRTIQNWETGMRTPPEYIIRLLEYRVRIDQINRKTVTLPVYDSRKADLPSLRDYVSAISWLQDVRKRIGEPFVFALDEALMCQGSFGGRTDEFLIWGYGSDSVSRFNGIVLLGNQINPNNVIDKNGLQYTDFNRTLTDALANEAILDMQGITEALSRYYYQNGESFEGLVISPEYQDRFAELVNDAI